MSADHTIHPNAKLICIIHEYAIGFVFIVHLIVFKQKSVDILASRVPFERSFQNVKHAWSSQHSFTYSLV